MKLALAIILALFCPCMGFSKSLGDNGIGIGHFIFPHYMGSPESYQYTFFFPFVAKSYLFFTGRDGALFSLDSRVTLPIRGDRLDAPIPEGFSATKRNIFREKSYARRGMGYTPPGLFLGPKIGYRIGTYSFDVASLAGIELGKDWQHIGFLHRASFKTAFFANRSAKAAGCVCLYVDGYWSSSKYNTTYYGVSDAFALPDRPLYPADRAGFLGLNTRLYLIKTLGAWSFMGFVSHQNMVDSIMADSPLVFKKEGTSAGAGLAYMLGF